MKNLLKYLPSWKTFKSFFNMVYYVGFISWFMLHIYHMSVHNYRITNEDLFIAMMFMCFAILDAIELLKEK